MELHGLPCPSSLPTVPKNVNTRSKPFSVPQLELAWKWDWGALERGLDSWASKGTPQTTAETKAAARPSPLSRARRAVPGGPSADLVAGMGFPKNRNSIGGVVV